MDVYFLHQNVWQTKICHKEDLNLAEKYVHVAANCKDKQRYGRCTVDNVNRKCKEGAKLKCWNCGGERSSVWWVQSQRESGRCATITESQGVSYAEAESVHADRCP